MRSTVAAFVAGTLFGLGLTVSRMIDPAKVLGFLDVTGSWDPSLALVMVGALAVMAIAYRIAGSRTGPILSGAFRIPSRRDVDSRLVTGAVIFGVGWRGRSRWSRARAPRSVRVRGGNAGGHGAAALRALAYVGDRRGRRRFRDW